MTRFSDLGLSGQTLKAVDDLGYTEPTPVQAQAIPAVLAGRDVIAAAKTGTGKTAAFGLPLMDQLPHARHGQGPLALVVTPTRELAMQIQEVCRAVAKRTGHRVTCVVGGVKIGPQQQELKRGCDLLIATPGRLVDLLNQGIASLDQVQTLVLDEADRMLDMGFLPDMRRIVGRCPADRQTLLFSATIDAAIQKNMAHLLTDPVFVEIAHKGEVADTIDHYLIRVDQRAKHDLLIALLKEKGADRVIVFARTRHRADACRRKLRRAGFSCEAIHSDRNQNQRKRALDAFAAGDVDVLVATDVLARGIDIPQVSYVVNMDIPLQAEDYVHRVGRAGRAGHDGWAVTFVTPENADELRDIQRLIKREIPSMELATFGEAEMEAVVAAKAALGQTGGYQGRGPRGDQSQVRGRSGRGKGKMGDAPASKSKEQSGRRRKRHRGGSQGVDTEVEAVRREQQAKAEARGRSNDDASQGGEGKRPGRRKHRGGKRGQGSQSQTTQQAGERRPRQKASQGNGGTSSHHGKGAARDNRPGRAMRAGKVTGSRRGR